jgi:hypothetical protein
VAVISFTSFCAIAFCLPRCDYAASFKSKRALGDVMVMQNDGVATTMTPTGAMDAQVLFPTLLHLEDKFNSRE